MQPNGHHLHEHIFLKASISRAWPRAHACMRVYVCRVGNQEQMLHAKSGGTRWESRTFLGDDKPSQSHTSTGMLGKQTGWASGCDAGWEDELAKGGKREREREGARHEMQNEEKLSLH